MKKVNVVVYKMTGKQLFFYVPESMCEDCDLSVERVKKVAKKIGDGKINIEIKPWFNHMMKVLLKGGWHPPVVMINGKVFSQGIVPDAQKLESRIRQEANYI